MRAGRAALGAVARPLRAAEGDRVEGASLRDPEKFPGWARGPAPSVSLFSLPQMWTRWLALALVAVAWVHAEVGERATWVCAPDGRGVRPGHVLPGWDREFPCVGRGGARSRNTTCET